jgi:hypothetical protein
VLERFGAVGRPREDEVRDLSQPSWPGKWHRPGYSLESVVLGAWRCFLKFALLTAGGQMRSSTVVTAFGLTVA